MSSKAYVVHFHLNVKPAKIKLMNKYNKTEKDSQTQRINWWLPWGRGMMEDESRDRGLVVTNYWE